MVAKKEDLVLNKSELVAKIAEKTAGTKKDAEANLNAFLAVVEETLAKKGKISLIGFGTFETRERAARTGINPQTREPLSIPASIVPAFKAGKKLKDAMPAVKKGKK